MVFNNILLVTGNGNGIQKSNFYFHIAWGGILVFWESRLNHVVNCEEMKLCKILALNVKLKKSESKILPIITVKWEEGS